LLEKYRKCLLINKYIYKKKVQLNVQDNQLIETVLTDKSLNYGD